jgi:hypothetical protein
MPSLFVKEERIDASPAVIGYCILKELALKSATRISIFDLASHFQHKPWYTPKNLYFGMMFLYAVGALTFEPPYIERHV